MVSPAGGANVLSVVSIRRSDTKKRESEAAWCNVRGDVAEIREKISFTNSIDF